MGEQGGYVVQERPVGGVGAVAVRIGEHALARVGHTLRPFAALSVHRSGRFGRQLDPGAWARRRATSPAAPVFSTTT